MYEAHPYGFRSEASGDDRLSNIQRHHFPPSARPMGASIPEMEVMTDLLFEKKLAEMTIVVEKGIGVADGKDDLHLTQLFKPSLAGQARKEMRRRVEIDRVIIVAVKQVAKTFDPHRQIVTAGKGDELAKEMGMTKHEAGCLESAEAAAMHDGAVMRVFLRHQRQDLVQNIFLEGNMSLNALGRMAMGTVEGLHG